MRPYTTDITPDEERSLQQSLRNLTGAYLRSSHRKRVERVERAYRFAATAHAGRRRRSGLPHITHPLEVANIVATELGLGSTSICAALLHDVLETREYTIDDLRDVFGSTIADIVGGLDRISGGILAAEREVDAARFRNLLTSMETDVRVILVKMADRMHNLRHISDLPAAKADKIAAESLYVYAPLAHRLGLNAFKEEFENLSFRHLYPERYADIVRRVEHHGEESLRLLERFLAPVRERLDEMGIKYQVKSRVKSAWSIHNKMQVKGIPFEQIYDVYAGRIIFESDKERSDAELCFTIRDVIRSLYTTSPERDRDWVTVPKSNGYSALHVTATPDGHRWIEIQIRSRRQDDIAELGYAAHWKYKEGEGAPGVAALEEAMAAVKDILDNPSPDGVDSLSGIRLNLLSPEIYVFTPRREVVRLRKGSTVLDMAYAVHSRLGEKCIGAKVNRALRHPGSRLESGDTVEILTSANARPDDRWLGWCTSPRTRAKIRRRLKGESVPGEEDEAGVSSRHSI